MKQHELRWMRLDNAAKLYPAAKRKNWLTSFRVSATLTEAIDVEILQSALDATVHRFPSIAVCIHKGLFWYYIEELPKAPNVRPDEPYPLANMKYSDLKHCCIKVLYYENRIALQFFHVVTDGNGGMIFLKTLLAEYVSQKYHINVPATNGILDRQQTPLPEELEDSFVKNSRDVRQRESERNSFQITGTKESDGYLNLITGQIPLDQILALSKEKNVTLTVFLAAVLMDSIAEIQKKKQPNRLHRKPIKVLLPVNLRNHFESKTLRNFILYITPSIDPSLGDYTFDEILIQVYHQLGAQLTDKQLSARFTGNVNAENKKILKIMPLFMKNFALRLIYDITGERKSCLSLSNLGAVKLPKELEQFVTRFDFILGPQATKPNNCAVLSYQNTLYINFIRKIEESELERLFFTKLRKMGLPVKIESNQRDEKKL